MDAATTNLSANIRKRAIAWCLLGLVTLLLSVPLFRVLPHVPDAHPTHVSEVIPWASAITADDIQRMEGTMRGPSASARFALTMATQFVLWGLMLLVARGMPNNAAARAGLIT